MKTNREPVIVYGKCEIRPLFGSDYSNKYY